MGWELKGKPTTLKVTSKLAKEWSEMEAAHVNRPLSERRIQVYRKVRESGGFRPVTWAKAWCEETGQFYRVNGKHTSTLFSDGQHLENLYVVVEEYHCDTLEDVAKLYATFDSQTQTRNATDINRSFAAVIPELAEMNTRFINLVVSALAAIPNDPSHTTGTPAERAEALFDNVELVVWLKKILGDNHTQARHIWRVSVVAAIIGCYKKSRSAAQQFWEAVRDETGATPDTPDRKLAKFLSTTVADVGARAGAPARFRITAREYYVKCVHAWNAWRKGESTMLRYVVDAKAPSFV